MLADYLHARAQDLQDAAVAKVGYRTIVAQFPEAAPDRATCKIIDEYSREVLGSKLFAPRLRHYAAAYGRFVEGWIPNGYFARIVLPAIGQRRNKVVTGAKTLARRTLQSDLFPDLAYHVRGVWLDGEGQPLADERVGSTIFAKGDTVFVKLDRSATGKGVRPLHRAGFDVQALSAFGDFVVQEAIRQAPVLAAVGGDAVATLRVTTTKGFGEPAKALPSFIRFGRAGSSVVEASSEVCVPVVDPQGRLAEHGIMHDWQRSKVHPDTGASFAGVTIPAYVRALAACTALHDTIPHLTIIGWDVAIDADANVRLLEWNTGHMEINVQQATAGACLAGLGWESLWRRQGG